MLREPWATILDHRDNWPLINRQVRVAPSAARTEGVNEAELLEEKASRNFEKVTTRRLRLERQEREHDRAAVDAMMPTSFIGYLETYSFRPFDDVSPQTAGSTTFTLLRIGDAVPAVDARMRTCVGPECARCSSRLYQTHWSRSSQRLTKVRNCLSKALSGEKNSRAHIIRSLGGSFRTKRRSTPDRGPLQSIEQFRQGYLRTYTGRRSRPCLAGEGYHLEGLGLRL